MNHSKKRNPTRWYTGLAAGVVLSLVSAGRAPGLSHPPSPGGHPDLVSLKTIEPQSEEIWIEYLRQSRVWSAVRTGELDILSGPAGRVGFELNQEVVCDYHTSGRSMGGATPKFLCEIGGRLYKVKYLPDGDPSSNREIFAEVAASRLFWALGFGADRNYPVRILCRGCPRDPHSGPSIDERRTGRYESRTRRLGIGIVEARFEGVTIETGGDSGWSWSELDRYVGTYASGEAPSARRSVDLAEIRRHVEALKLLQVFVQHGDCKPRQQRLVCLPGAVSSELLVPRPGLDEEDEEEWEGVLDDDTGTACADSFMIVDDLGATFGGAGNMTGSSAKMDLDHWSDKPVFDLDHYEESGGQCKGVLNISSSCGGGVENPVITESGRRFLLERLERLSDQQIRDIFVAARVDQLEKDRDRYDGGLRGWVQTFKAKVRQIESVSCRDP